MSPHELKMTVKVDKLYLATNNPRHDEVDSEGEAIAKLCKTEDIAEIARDIARYGMDPSARLIVYPVQEGLGADAIDDQTTFFTAEGNRRLCALKLLHDPDNAPAHIRAAIERASNQWISQIDDVDVVVILDEDRRRHWLNRIHNGAQGGVGRKQWSTEQKTRFNGTKRNVVAQSLLDFAETQGLISAADRSGSFSHMARLTGNVLMADTLGLDASNGPDDLLRNRPFEVFELALKAVLCEAIEKKLGSQATKAAIDSLAREIQMQPGFTNTRIPPEPLSRQDAASAGPSGGLGGGGTGNPGGGTDPDQPEHKPKKPKRATNIRGEAAIESGLNEIGFAKLSSLYASICLISAKDHTPLVAVGVWSFLESLTAAMGRKEGTAFSDYLNNSKLESLGVGKGKALKAPTTALSQIANQGNLTKHHKISAQFDYSQLINDMGVLTDVIVACIEDIKTNG